MPTATACDEPGRRADDLVAGSSSPFRPASFHQQHVHVDRYFHFDCHENLHAHGDTDGDFHEYPDVHPHFDADSNLHSDRYFD